MTAQRPEIVYKPSPTIQAFQDDPSFVRAIRGPVGSGKSVGCTIELFRLACQSGTNTRSAIIRNTFPQLRSTTLNTWMDWLRPFGEFKWSTMTFLARIEGYTHEFLFQALDKSSDIGRLLSLELTFSWVNECREIQWPIIDMLTTRVGRYPARKDGIAPRSCIIMDTNSPDDMSSYYKCFEERRPKDWKQFVQPAGDGPLGENVDNLPPGYYERIRQGKDDAWCKVYIGGEYGYIAEGRPVYGAWQDNIHAAQCERDPELPLIVGIDFGLEPACVFLQESTTGQFRVVDELVTQEFSALELGELLGQRLRKDWRDHTIEIFGDPAGDQRSQVDKRTAFQVLRAAGIDARPAPTNDFRLRVEAVMRNLKRLTMAGEPGLIVSPRCKYLRRACAGGYKYRLMQVVGEERFAELPDKNSYSHVAEALQYALCGAGQARKVVGTRDRKPLDYSNFDPMRV